MSNSFVTVDFETANASRASACSMGLVRVEDGEVVEKFTSLIKPHGRHAEFGRIQMGIHGITPEDVAYSPTLKELWPKIQSFVGNFPLVAHNAKFDFDVWQKSLRSWNIILEKPKGYCTYETSKRELSFSSYRLPDLVDSLALPKFDHHNALSDATACADLTLFLLERVGELTSFVSPSFQGDSFVSKAKHLQIPPDFSHLNLEDYDFSAATWLDGKHVLFTGTPMELDQKAEGWYWVEVLNGIAEKNWTKNVNILVTCTQDPRQLKEGHDKSGKHEKAEKALEEGHDIEIIDEAMFLSFLPTLKTSE